MPRRATFPFRKQFATVTGRETTYYIIFNAFTENLFSKSVVGIKKCHTETKPMFPAPTKAELKRWTLLIKFLLI